MRYQKCSIDLYTDFLIGSQKRYSGLEFSKASPDPMAHDSVSRRLSREKLTPKLLWNESRHMIDPSGGYLSIDDSVLDKPYSREIPLVKKQYSGKHHRPVKGIDIVNEVWTDGEKIIPIDYRIYDPTHDGKTKNDHAREMLAMAKRRELKPQYVLMDAWFTSIGNLKAIDSYDWKWIGEIKCNRLVSVKRNEYVHVENLDWASKQVHKV